MTVTEPRKTDPFLSGNYAPVMDELDVADLPVVQGQIPTALRGAYLRNGANPAFEPMGAYHWFDGDGMIHGVYLEDGKASYRNKWVNTVGLELERDAGKNLFGGLANFQFPSEDLFAKMGGPFKNAANTHIVRHAGKVLALWEGGHPYELNLQDLETVGMYNFDGKLVDAMTAHPHMDPHTGEMLFFGYDQINGMIRFYVADDQGVITRIEEINLPNPVMMHDFQITEKYAVFLDAPAVVNIEGSMNGEAPVLWKPEEGARFGLLPRAGSGIDDMVWIDVDPMYVFHFMNSFDNPDGTVTVDACRFKQMNMPTANDAPPTPEEMEEMAPRLARIHIDPAKGTATWETIGDRPSEFPRIAMADEGRSYRYGYAPTSDGNGVGDGAVAFNSLLKFDHQTNETTVYSYGPTSQCGEASFCPDPDGKNDDDGWLVNYVYDHATGKSSCVLLDARDMTLTATIEIPRRIPFGFHGNWMPNES